MAAVRIASRIANYYCVHKNYEYQYRSIFSTTQLQQSSWMNKVKNVFTGQKTGAEGDASQLTSDSFTLLNFADQMKKARKVGAFKDFMVGRCSEATVADAFKKYEAIIRFLGALDPTGKNLKLTQKQEAAKHCDCTITDVENALAKFTWAKEAQKKIDKLKEEGKPMPTSIAEFLLLLLLSSSKRWSVQIPWNLQGLIWLKVDKLAGMHSVHVVQRKDIKGAVERIQRLSIRQQGSLIC